MTPELRATLSSVGEVMASCPAGWWIIGSAAMALHGVDPGSVKDFEAFAKQTGNELLESTEGNGEFAFRLKKG